MINHRAMRMFSCAFLLVFACKPKADSQLSAQQTATQAPPNPGLSNQTVVNSNGAVCGGLIASFGAAGLSAIVDFGRGLQVTANPNGDATVNCTAKFDIQAPAGFRVAIPPITFKNQAQTDAKGFVQAQIRWFASGNAEARGKILTIGGAQKPAGFIEEDQFEPGGFTGTFESRKAFVAFPFTPCGGKVTMNLSVVFVARKTQAGAPDAFLRTTSARTDVLRVEACTPGQ